MRRVSEAFEAPEAAGVVLRAEGVAGLRQAAFRIAGAPASGALRPPPHYAAHTREVLAELGASPGVLSQWLASGGAVDASE